MLRINRSMPAALVPAVAFVVGLTGCSSESGYKESASKSASNVEEAAAAVAVQTEEVVAAADEASEAAPERETMVVYDDGETKLTQTKTTDPAKMLSADLAEQFARAAKDAKTSLNDGTAAANIAQVDPAKAATEPKTPPKRANQYTLADPATFPVKITPARLDLGTIPTGDVGRGSILLNNTGDKPILLNQCKTSCGCTAAKCPRGKYIQPGDEVEVEITLKGGQRTTTLSKKVTLMFEDDKKLEVTVTGQAVAYVVVEPSTINPDEVADGRMVIRSIDGEPFRITRMTPAILGEEVFSAEPLEEHIIYMDWAKWQDLGGTRKLTFFMDHPKCERVLATVRPTRRPTDVKPGAAAGRTPPQRGVAGGAGQAESMIKRRDNEAFVAKYDKGEISPDLTDRSGASLLAMCAKQGNTELMDFLLEKGADLEAKDNVGRTPLMVAAQTKNPETVRVLIDSGASLEPRDLVGSSALSWAAGFGHPDSVGMLIEAGADLEVAGAPTGFTPLIWAAGFGDPLAVKGLVEAGAQLETQDFTHGLTALMHAARTGANSGGKEKIAILLEAGADLEARDASGKTPLLVAAEASGATAEMVNTLILAGADVSATDERGQTALDLAKKRTDPRGGEVRELLEKAVAGDGDN